MEELKSKVKILKWWEYKKPQDEFAWDFSINWILKVLIKRGKTQAHSNFGDKKNYAKCLKHIFINPHKSNVDPFKRHFLLGVGCICFFSITHYI